MPYTSTDRKIVYFDEDAREFRDVDGRHVLAKTVWSSALGHGRAAREDAFAREIAAEEAAHGIH